MSKKQKKAKKTEGQSVLNWLPLLMLPFKNLYKKSANGRKAVKTKKRLKKLALGRLMSAMPLLLIALGAGGTIYFGVKSGEDNKKFNIVSTYSPPVPDKIKSNSQKGGLSPSKPTHIKVPSLGINSQIITVGKDKKGAMEIPDLFSHKAGWYKFGPTPGEIGPAIIVGHVDTYKGPSIFFRLIEMKKGDMIEIKREDGKTVKFKVDGLQQFDQNKFPTEKVYGNIDESGLRLITCGGTFNRQTGKYDRNTVVFATMINK